MALTADGMPGTDCTHERSHIVDSRFFGHRYSTPATRRIFCDLCRFQRWLDVEVALARSQAQLGMIPEWAADEIARVARLEHVDLDEVQDGVQHTAHALVSLLGAVRAACEGDAGEYLHHGATTQDIIDTGLVLDMRAVLDEIGAELAGLVGELIELAARHRDTLMIGRTHARPALPTTFGLKVAGWVDELLRHGERLGAMRKRVLVVELHGGVGTMAGFDGRGAELVDGFARRLSLYTPALGWHVARDRVAEFATTLAMLSATLGRVGDEVRMLSRPEYGELEEEWRDGRVGSSTMPHKRNPEGLQQVVVLGRLARASATLTVEAMLTQEHERDGRGTRLEWTAVPEVSHYTLASLATLRPILAGLTVRQDHMAAQASQAAEQLCSEALVLALARSVGKHSAHELVCELSQASQSIGVSLRTALASRPDITGKLEDGALERVLDPARYVGEAGQLVDRVLADARRWLDHCR